MGNVENFMDLSSIEIECLIIFGMRNFRLMCFKVILIVVQQYIEQV